jgi:hypothetical protein
MEEQPWRIDELLADLRKEVVAYQSRALMAGDGHPPLNTSKSLLPPTNDGVVDGSLAPLSDIEEAIQQFLGMCNPETLSADILSQKIQYYFYRFSSLYVPFSQIETTANAILDSIKN